jgi:hypothetical protein
LFFNRSDINTASKERPLMAISLRLLLSLHLCFAAKTLSHAKYIGSVVKTG